MLHLTSQTFEISEFKMIISPALTSQKGNTLNLQSEWNLFPYLHLKAKVGLITHLHLDMYPRPPL